MELAIFLSISIAMFAVFFVNELSMFVLFHNEWKLWHNIWDNIDTFKPEGCSARYYTSDKFPNKRLVVWKNYDSALFDIITDECILCSFYKRYSKKCATYLINKHK